MEPAAAPVRAPWPEPPDPGSAREIAEGVLWMRIPLAMRPDHVNVYALDEPDGWTLVDTGLDTPACREAWAALIGGPLKGRRIVRVVVTHHHPDHVGLAGWFQAHQGAALWTTRTAWLYARMLQLDEQARPSPQALAFWRAAGMEPDLLAARARGRPFNFADVTAPLPVGYRRIAQGDRIEAGGRGWRVEIGHGHAPEHATLWGEDHDLVLTGDQVIAGITPNLGVHPTEPEADPVGDWMESCARLGVLARPGHLALPGHRLPFTGLRARLDALHRHQSEALARLEGFLAGPRTGAECFRILYGREIGAAEYGLALAEAMGHLNHLARTGRVRRTDRGDGVWLWERMARVADFPADTAARSR